MNAIPRSRGFTLLELLVALSVFALVAAMAYSGLQTVLQGKHQTEQYEKRMQDIQTAVMMLDSDLQQLARRPVRDEYGDEEAALKSGMSGDYLISFTRNGRPNPAGLKRSNLQRVAYGIRDEKLIRYSWSELDRAPGSAPQSVALLDDVRGLKLRFLTADRKWSEQWPPLVAASTEADNENALLPLGIDVTIETDRPGDIRRLVPLSYIDATDSTSGDKP